MSLSIDDIIEIDHICDAIFVWADLHIMPQLFFLTAPSNPWKPYPVNYVGNMTEMIQSTFDIVYHFYWNSSLYLQSTKKSKTLSVKEAWKKWDQNFHHGL